MILRKNKSNFPRKIKSNRTAVKNDMTDYVINNNKIKY